MVKKLLVSVLFLGILFPLAAVAAQGPLASFDGGIGVIPVSSGVVAAGTQPLTSEAVNRNFVRGVQPAGQIWVIERLRADVRRDGRINVDGRGLVLGGGNNIGRATGQSVFATLICEALPPFVERNTNVAGVLLEPNGDFRIDDVLSPAPVDCASPMLLIRTAGSGNWFAAGILMSERRSRHPF